MNYKSSGNFRTGRRGARTFVSSAILDDKRTSSIAVIVAVLALALITCILFVTFGDIFVFPTINWGVGGHLGNGYDERGPYATVTKKNYFVAKEGGSSLADATLYSERAILVCLSDMSTVAHKNADEKMYPASMTKVMTVVGAYREAVDAVLAGTFTPELAETLVERTRRFFHREYSKGLYYGRPGVDQFTDGPNSFAKEVKRHSGVVLDYFLKAKIAQVKIQDAALKVGDLVQVHGPTTGVQEFRIESLRRDDEIPEIAEKGTWVTFPAPRCRVGDKVFLICPTEQGACA